MQNVCVNMSVKELEQKIKNGHEIGMHELASLIALCMYAYRRKQGIKLGKTQHLNNEISQSQIHHDMHRYGQSQTSI